MACDEHDFIPSDQAHLQPLSIAPADIGAALTASPFSHGIHFTSELQDRELHLTVTHVPAETQEVGPIRAVMQLGRLADDGFDQLVLVNGGRKLFAISETDLRDIGCRFIWPQGGGADPILLLRETVQAIHDYDTKKSIAGESSGAPVVSAAQALRLIGETINPAWVSHAEGQGEPVEEPDAPEEQEDSPPPFNQAALAHPSAMYLDQRL